MKLKKVVPALALAAFMSLSCVACASGGTEGGNQGDDGNQGEKPGGEVVLNPIPEATGTVADEEGHFVEGTLHEVNVDFQNPIGAFIENGKTQYAVVTDDGDANEAVSFLNKQILAASGTVLEKKSVSSLAEADRYVVFGNAQTFEAAGLEMPSYDTIGAFGYAVRTKGNSVFIGAFSANGYRLGAIAFLREVFGYDMLSEDRVVFENKGEVLPALDIVERPDFDFIMPSNAMGADGKYGMGFTTQDPFINTGTSWVHNIIDFVGAPGSETRTQHPKWFSDGSVDSEKQACFTAHGDREEYAAMVDYAFGNLLGFLKSNPSKSTILISQMDNATDDRHVGGCNCEICTEYSTYYGGAENTVSGAMLIFVNDLADKLDEYLKSEQAAKDGFDENTEINLVMLVYGWSISAPVERDASGNIVYDSNGKGIPVEYKRFWLDEGNLTEETEQDAENGATKLVCHNRVSVMYAASAADYTESFYHAKNAFYANTIKAWSGLGGGFYVWSYQISYYQYLYPYNSYDSIAEDLRFFKDHGAKYIYSQGTWENKNNSGFTKLRDYIMSKAAFDVNCDYAALVDKFFKDYFCEAEPYMREFFDICQSHLRQLQDQNKVSGSVHNWDLGKQETWPEGMINTFMRLIDQAYEAIAKYETSDPELYEVLSTHILIESLFPRYVLCVYYTDSFSADALLEMRLAFKADFTKLQNVTDVEHYTISDLYKGWGID